MACRRSIRVLCALMVALCLGQGAWADVRIVDPYARASGPKAKVGAAFLIIENHGDTADRLIAVESPTAKRVELHTHLEQDGIMQMRKLDDGVLVPAHRGHAFERGKDHLMFLGLTAPWIQGDLLSVTLVFQNAGAVTVEIPVDHDRKPNEHGAGGAHSGHSNHSN